MKQMLAGLMALMVGVGSAQAGSDVLSEKVQAALDKPFSAHSGEQRTQLIELFTSEGCSSCPPADRWLSEYMDNPGLWQRYVPVAFHIDYWDYIGWEDRFASALYTSRQYQYKRSDATRQVYTPQFVVNGKEWRGWFSRWLPGVRLPEAQDKPGRLQFSVEKAKLAASFDSAAPDQAPVLNVALLASDISSQVTRGENRSKVLEHDFVVLNHRQYFPQGQGSTVSYAGDVPPAPAIANEAGKLAWAVWVEEQGVPIQATGGWVLQ